MICDKRPGDQASCIQFKGVWPGDLVSSLLWGYSHFGQGSTFLCPCRVSSLQSMVALHEANEHVTDKRLKSHGMSLESRPSIPSASTCMWYLGQHLNITRSQNQKTTCVPSSCVTSSDNVQTHDEILMQQPQKGSHFILTYSTVGQSRFSNLLLLLMLQELHLERNACAADIPQSSSSAQER
jgi:hypothetical protein